MHELTTIQTKLQEIEDKILEQPQVEVETGHYIADGVYLRSILIPEGATLTGAVHLTETIDVMVYGDLTVVTEEGTRRITKAGSVFVSKPGLKKVAYAHKETLWMTVHAVDNIKEKTMDDIEKELWVDSYRDYQLLLTQKEGN